ncbi:hypothetical protein WR25_11305 [Diploscapter pachys]|uniref:mitogen-activated protein kinase kinase n=1 Tax=Diploscapter pachys TaxID=2018661 RepID=A0A2A2K8U1_9BILA|nr:hypothetical protein WR25_11305 [Diploscapter pachys]
MDLRGGMTLGMGMDRPGPINIPPNAPSENGQQQPVDPRKFNLLQKLGEINANSGIITIKGVQRRVNASDLKFISEIGHGSCGHVTRQSFDGVVFAVKTMVRSNIEYEMQRVLMDIDVISKCHSSFIVKCIGYFITPSEVKVCMELMATCLDRLLIRMNHQPFPEPMIGRVNYAVVKALDYLKREHQIMHRDVKPSNILLSWNGEVKLCDFGISGRLIESRAHSRQAGCPLYMGPERFDPKSSDYTILSDVWSLGVSLMELATGRYPFLMEREFDMIMLIIEQPPPQLRAEDNFTPEFCDLVNNCLRKNPEERPRYEAILQHPFTKAYENAPLEEMEEWFVGHMEEE